jgi:hypothetical protein
MLSYRRHRDSRLQSYTAHARSPTDLNSRTLPCQLMHSVQNVAKYFSTQHVAQCIGATSCCQPHAISHTQAAVLLSRRTLGTRQRLALTCSTPRGGHLRPAQQHSPSGALAYLEDCRVTTHGAAWTCCNGTTDAKGMCMCVLLHALQRNASADLHNSAACHEVYAPQSAPLMPQTPRT